MASQREIDKFEDIFGDDKPRVKTTFSTFSEAQLDREAKALAAVAHIGNKPSDKLTEAEWLLLKDNGFAVAKCQEFAIDGDGYDWMVYRRKTEAQFHLPFAYTNGWMAWGRS